MSEIESLQNEVSLARRELKNIRQEVMKLKANVRNEAAKIISLTELDCKSENKCTKGDQEEKKLGMVPIGFIASCFKNKNGIPRQPSLCHLSRGSLEIDKTFFTNPEHSLIGLSEFSYIWILFVFHQNAENSAKAKVHPPRLNGKSVGVFSTRSPHRPNAIGLSLVKLDKIIGNTLFLSGLDILDETPVLDIKPYIPFYDTPLMNKSVDDIPLAKNQGFLLSNKTLNEVAQDKTFLRSNQTNIPKRVEDSKSAANEGVLSSLLKSSPNQLKVLFTKRANQDIEKFHAQNYDVQCDYCLNFFANQTEAKQAIIDILQNDPRSTYRRNKCSDKLYYFEVDKLHITCWFDENDIAEVLRVKSVNKCVNSE